MIKSFATLLSLTAIVAGIHPAAAQDYPNQPIRIVVPYTAGGGTDTLARTFTREFEKAIGQTIIVENKAGAGGMIGALEVVQARPNGYTFLIGDLSTNGLIPASSKAPRYHPVDDFTPIGILLDVPQVFVITPSLPASTLPEFIALAKAKPDELNNASAGAGSFSHVTAEWLNILAGLRIVQVHYRGGADLLPALANGESHFGIMPMRIALQQIEKGALKPIAVTSQRRSPALPNVPPAGETVPGYVAVNWYGMFGPANLPPPIVAKVAAALDKAVDSPAMQEFAKADGTVVQKMTPAAFKQFVSDDYRKWSKLVDDAGIPKN